MLNLLCAKIMETVDIIEKTQKAQELKNKLNKYKNFESTINRIYDYFNNYKDMFLLINSHKPELAPKPSLEVVVNLIDEAENFLKRRDIPGNSFQLNFIKIIEENEKDLKENWFQYINSIIGSLNNTLQMLENLYDNSDDIKKLRLDIKRMEGKWPFTETELDYFKRSVKESKEIIESLDVSNNIKEFLIKVSKREASVLDLSEEVMDWLEKNKFNEKLSIRFKNN